MLLPVATRNPLLRQGNFDWRRGAPRTVAIHAVRTNAGEGLADVDCMLHTLRPVRLGGKTQHSPVAGTRAGCEQDLEDRVSYLGLVSMGGTIAEARSRTGGVRHLPAAELIERYGVNDAAVRYRDLCAVNSSDLTVAHLLSLATVVLEHLDDPACGGIVITTGTSTLEDVATFLAALVATVRIDPIPVVVTGAMRPACDANSDGERNLRDSLWVASQHIVTGVWVAFAGRLHSGWNLAKLRPDRVDPFISLSSTWPVLSTAQLREAGAWPSGWAGDGAPPSPFGAPWHDEDSRMSPAAALGRLRWVTPPRVPLVTMHLGMDASRSVLPLLNDSDALVLGAFGDGQVPVDCVRTLAAAPEPPVVLAAQQYGDSPRAWERSDLSAKRDWNQRRAPVSFVRAPARLVRMATISDLTLGLLNRARRA